MRKECDTLRQDNVKKDMELLKSSLFHSASHTSDEPYFPSASWTELPGNQSKTEVVMKPILKNPLRVSSYMH